MPMKGSGTADLEVIDRFEGGAGWLAYPDEKMRRASHAVVGEGGVWVIDPVDAEGVDDLLTEYGDVAGVVVLLDRHKRDAATLANRHDVAVHVPNWMSGVESDIEAPTESFTDSVGGFEARRLVDNPFWQEAVLFDGETLVVSEALGTSSYFRTAREVVGVHPMLRMLPPKSLREYDPDRLLVGHGEGVFEDLGAAIDDTISNSRVRAPGLYLKTAKNFLGF